jgi:hypothetical protein
VVCSARQAVTPAFSVDAASLANDLNAANADIVKPDTLYYMSLTLGYVMLQHTTPLFGFKWWLCLCSYAACEGAGNLNKQLLNSTERCAKVHRQCCRLQTQKIKDIFKQNVEV